MFCQYCKNITIENLIGLDQEDRQKAEFYGISEFASVVHYMHHPTFDSLCNSASDGCDFCTAIQTEFTKANLLDDIIQRKLYGRDTNVSICIGTTNRESKHRYQAYDRILVAVGFTGEGHGLEAMSQAGDSLKKDPSNELDSQEYIPEQTDLDDPATTYGEKTISEQHNAANNSDIDLSDLSEGEEEELSDYSMSSSKFEALEEVEVYGELHIKFSLTRHKKALLDLSNRRIGRPNFNFALDSPDYFNLARKWLHTCLSEHHDSKCPSLRDRTFPTRVIDIGCPTQGRNPRLFITRGRYGQYAALTHCWGGKMPIKTTQATLHSHCQGFPLDVLPQSFRDAISITRELGLRYLWIDSLCIIQDCQSDWMQESSKMADVYQNAVITIAAAGAKDCESGIMSSSIYQSIDFRQYCSFKLNHESSDSESFVVSTFYGETFEDCLYGLALGRRGWTFQERLLASRVLHYGRNQIYYQCRTSELAADDFPKAKYSEALKNGALLEIPRFLGSTHFPTFKQQIYNKWLSLVESYCIYRRLTYSRDKLPAMAGLAAVFHGLTNDQYLAGIWRGDFARGLLWMIVHNKYNKVIQYAHRAPSWAWARWDGYIGFHFADAQFMLDASSSTLIDTSIQLVGQHEFGQVEHGALCVRAWIAQWPRDEIHKLGLLIVDIADDNGFQVHEPDKDFYYSSLSFSIFPGGDRLVEESFRLLETPMPTIMLVGSFLSVGSRNNNPFQFVKKGMLVLRPATHSNDKSSPGIYERIGIIVHHTDVHGELRWDSRWSYRELTII